MREVALDEVGFFTEEYRFCPYCGNLFGRLMRDISLAIDKDTRIKSIQF